MNHEIESIISGKSKIKHGDVIQAIASYLRRSQSSSKTTEREEYFPKQEKERLIEYIDQHKLWIVFLDWDKFVSSGAEQKVYLKDDKTVIKLNDAIYYASWLEYFYSLLLNNYFFPDTAYCLKVFINKMT
jgi:hypothetical protein